LGQWIRRIMPGETRHMALPHHRIEPAGKPQRNRVRARLGIARPIENSVADRCRAIEMLGEQITEKGREWRAELPAPFGLEAECRTNPVFSAIRQQPWSPPSAAWQAPASRRPTSS